ncbi:F-box only protein 34 [Siniperca chuatsi]|uniref:F-box only protein 34 n=1 Tax=Siniperca chuatsi TaxID=119488 RepID=UPI001CE1147C|nr:F-box only protein 34 [Siniperca chuatsi]XP_044023806.1 F-box only protein 34 [Siniperca chuatsi]XP_044023807.1 F-box only protein 34 [Siniperca chuatsi]
MHLKSYPKLVRSELRLEVVGVQTLSQQSSQQGALLRTYSSNHGNISSSRLPFGVISTNTLHRSDATNHVSSGVTSLRLKASLSAALQLLPPPPGCENDTLRLYQTAAEDAPLDIWTVIKPGHVREKIAIFASDRERTDGDSRRTSTSGSGSRDRTNHAAMSGLLRAVKAKGSWEENSSAKRRRRSGNNQNVQQDQRTRVLDTQQHAHKPSAQRSDSTPLADSRRCGGDAVTAAEEEEQKVSVGEMVAFLEQRASEQQPDSKPLLALQRSSTTITLSRAPPPEIREGSEVRGEEPESIKVSDMVAKLESECLKRRTEGDLSRSNSLRRAVGRVLLAAGDLSSTPDQPSSPSSMTSSSSSLSSLPGDQSEGKEPTSCSEPPASALATPLSPGLATPLPPPSGEAAVEAQEAGGLETQRREAPPPRKEGAEPLPGLLFLSPAASETLPHTDSEPRPPRHRMTFDLEPAPSQPRPPPARSDSGSQSEKRRRRRKADRAQEEVVGATPRSAVVPLGRRVTVSQDFLEMRQRLQQLLEPQPYLAVLPHHLLVKIFLLLPTQSLAALKCTCHYFKFIIDNYGVRPADSLWVSDPRYRDDPCKQCKKRYGRGDVSLCRWHHKPYCQALPYGPGYWMCCHGGRRDAPGCNVGLHDNRWVPAFHSINVPIYRRSRADD